jgi:hypothetical protein
VELQKSPCLTVRHANLIGRYPPGFWAAAVIEVGLVVWPHLGDDPHCPVVQFGGIRGKCVTCLDADEQLSIWDTFQ